MTKNLKVAIVHEWFETYAGSERVVQEFLNLYPHADVFALVDFMPEEDRGFLSGKPVQTTFIQHMPFAKRHFRKYLALMPLAIEQLDLRAYDLIISSAHAVAKGIIVGPDQVHVSYVHSPMRYAWDMQQQYLVQSNLSRGVRSWLARSVLHYLRLWDSRTSPGVDVFVANSTFIAKRIQRIYGRSSQVVHPPVDIESFQQGGTDGDYYITASRLVPYKRVDLVVEAFGKMPDKQLLVVGDGPQAPRIASLAAGRQNITLLGHISTSELAKRMRHAKAFVFAAEEDFGILPVEAQACGTPVIAFGRGGTLDTVIEGVTGLYFDSQTPEAIIDAVSRFEADYQTFSSVIIRQHAEGFSSRRFLREMKKIIDDAMSTRNDKGSTT